MNEPFIEPFRDTMAYGRLKEGSSQSVTLTEIKQLRYGKNTQILESYDAMML